MVFSYGSVCMWMLAVSLSTLQSPNESLLWASKYSHAVFPSKVLSFAVKN